MTHVIYKISDSYIFILNRYNFLIIHYHVGARSYYKLRYLQLKIDIYNRYYARYISAHKSALKPY